MIFQKDNARPDSANYTRQVLAENRFPTLRPSRSPDLSPIEHVWDILGRRIYARNDTNNVRQLEAAVFEEWANYWRRSTNWSTSWGNVVPLWCTTWLLYTRWRPVWLLGCNLYMTLTLTCVLHYLVVVIYPNDYLLMLHPCTYLSIDCQYNVCANNIDYNLSLSC